MRSVLLLVTGLTACAAVLLWLPRSPAICATTAPLGSTRGARARPPVLPAAAALAVAAGTWVLLGGTAGPAAGCVAGVATWWFVGRLEPASARRRRERLAAALPHAVDLMAACLAAGLSPGGALEQVAAAVGDPMRAELEALSARLRFGVDPVTVWGDASSHPQLGTMCRALARAVESGASVAEAMVRLSDDLRARTAAGVEARARSVGVKAAVPLGVCLLPAFVLVGVVPLVAGSVSVLLTH